jgi:hypothetical protein
MLLKSLKKWLVAATLVLAIPAFADSTCGPVVVDKTISGRVLASIGGNGNGTGYVGGAKICFDNGEGGCDSTLPSTMSDYQGKYTLTLTGDVGGKQINALISTSSSEYGSFANNFTLAATVSSATQNISPLTTMMVSQAKIHRDSVESLQRLKVLTGNSNLDPAADYNANGDTKSVAVSHDLVQRLIWMGEQNVSWLQVIAILNAAAATENVGAVTAWEVNTQFADPAFSIETNAATVLANPSYSILGALVQSDAAGFPTMKYSPVREHYTLNAGTLTITEENQSNGSWIVPTPPAGTYGPSTRDFWRNISWNGGYVMIADNTWSGYLTYDQMKPTFTGLMSSGSALVGKDSVTGDDVSIKYRTFDATGQALSTAVQIGVTNILNKMTGSFPQGTMAYLATVSHANDLLMLTNQGIGNSWINGAPSYQSEYINGRYVTVLGPIGVAHSSVLDAVGMSFDVGGGCYLLNILPNNVATVDKSGGSSCNYTNSPVTWPITASWSIHPRNSQVMVIDLPKELNNVNLPLSTIKDIAAMNWKYIVAVKDSRLMTGYSRPAWSTTTMQFTDSSVTDSVTAEIRASLTRLGYGYAQNP